MSLDNLSLTADRCTSRGELVRDYIYFTPVGSGDPTVYGGENLSTITREAAGHYEITLRECGASLVGVFLGIRDATAGTATSGAYDASAKTLQVYLADVATPTASDAADMVFVELVWKKTGLI